MLFDEILSQKSILSFVNEDFKLFLEDNKKFFLNLKKSFFEKNVFFIGSGSSYNISFFSKNIFEDTFKKPYFNFFSSEFYKKNFFIKDSLFLLFSQSGLTSDTKKASEKIKKDNTIILFSNNKKPKIKYDFLINTNISREEAVQSTKTFTSMLLQVLLLNDFFKNKKNTYNFEYLFEKNFLKKIEVVAKKVKDKKNFIFLGLNEYYALSLEGSLKFKEIAKKNSEAYSILEYFHGYIEETINKEDIIIILDECKKNTKKILEKNKDNIIITTKKYEKKEIKNNIIINVKEKYVSKIIILQLLAYYIAKHNNINPEKVYKIKKTI